MSIVDLNNLSDTGLVAQYVIDLLGQGHFLSRDDHARIESWIKLGVTVDDILIVLSEVLPDRIENARAQGQRIVSLASVGKIVERRLKDRRSMVGSVVRE